MQAKKLDLPTIDITPLLLNQKEEAKQSVAEQLRQAAETYGAFYITSLSHPTFNPGGILAAARALFELERSEKDRLPLIKPGGFTRGYIPFGGESGSERLEVKEAFSYGYNWPEGRTPDNGLQGNNEWPPSDTLCKLDSAVAKAVGESDVDREKWKNVLHEFYDGMCEISHVLSRGLSLSLGQPEDYFEQYCKGSNEISLLRLFHYFKSSFKSDDTTKERIGSSPHTDWGFLTLILQPTMVPGLEVFQDNAWHEVPTKPQTIFVNCGDYMSLLTQGRYISPLHRVSLAQEERYSMVFFFYPSYDAEIPILNGDTAQDYSLFNNQRNSDHSASAGKGVETLPAFGDYIVEKWRQVFREGGRY
ncbi:Clavaminate synthase-like protein [Basidiobolus meristosporus CBS 931.73]|uniref:Clavaminate synthase-like protein n=1 Tax=Basidiobolus meristosporus CBS 931.73 TaxID=1314790 RepID=A0A1Y1YF39_9FUNG|nr:Clavaminate synthase-like protein [Basidiobolus meristosporus CBS 931.73]|eukprot:ORX96214.1 Clavaminate synthase-like protein [Basidiobolus meristosporus CBS 931.73]